MWWKGATHVVHPPSMRRLFSSYALPSPPSPTAPIGLSQQALTHINSHDNRISRIQAALDLNFFALAALIAAKKPPAALNLETQQRIVRGLVQYHPRLTPINLKAIIGFHKAFKFEMDSIDKAILLKTLISYNDHQLVQSGINLIDRAAGGPIPNSAIMALVSFAKERHALQTCVYIWKYMLRTYPVSLPDFNHTMVNLMEMFARSRNYKEYAEEVALECIHNASHPRIALSIAKVCYKLENDALFNTLCKTPGFEMTRSIQGIAKQMKARSETPAKDTSLTPQEFSGVIKAVAKRDIENARRMVHEICGDHDLEGIIDYGSEDESQRYLLAQVALCNQYIEEGSYSKFQESLKAIHNHELWGIVLNLKLKWELKYGSFQHAKRHFQNIQNVPLKQRVIALNTISRLALDEDDKSWIAAQRRSLLSSKSHY